MNFNKNKTIPRIKIGITIIVSFMLVQTLSPVVFLANTPQINPQLAQNLQLVPARTMAFLRNPLDSTQAQREVELEQVAKSVTPPSQELNYKPITTGVQAAEDPSTGKKYVKIVAGTELEVKYLTLSDGRVVKVYTKVQ